MDDQPDDRDPDDRENDELRDMLQQFLSGNGEIDPAKLASAAGLPNDPEMVAQLISQLQSALQSSGEGVNWGLALEQATGLAQRSSVVSLPAERSQLEQAFHVASLWLAEATQISELTAAPRLISRTEWVTLTMPIWTQLAEPVATSIADALTGVIQEQAGDELEGMMANASQ